MIHAALLQRLKGHRLRGQALLGLRKAQRIVGLRGVQSAPPFVAATLVDHAPVQPPAANNTDLAMPTEWAQVQAEHIGGLTAAQSGPIPVPVGDPHLTAAPVLPIDPARAATLPPSFTRHQQSKPLIPAPGAPPPTTPPVGSSGPYRPPTMAELRDTLLALREQTNEVVPPVKPAPTSVAQPLPERVSLGRRVTHIPGFNPGATAAPPIVNQPSVPEMQQPAQRQTDLGMHPEPQADQQPLVPSVLPALPIAPISAENVSIDATQSVSLPDPEPRQAEPSLLITQQPLFADPGQHVSSTIVAEQELPTEQAPAPVRTLATAAVPPTLITPVIGADEPAVEQRQVATTSVSQPFVSVEQNAAPEGVQPTAAPLINAYANPTNSTVLSVAHPELPESSVVTSALQLNPHVLPVALPEQTHPELGGINATLQPSTGQISDFVAPVQPVTSPTSTHDQFVSVIAELAHANPGDSPLAEPLPLLPERGLETVDSTLLLLEEPGVVATPTALEPVMPVQPPSILTETPPEVQEIEPEDAALLDLPPMPTRLRETTRALLHAAVGFDPAEVPFERSAKTDAITGLVSADALTDGEQVLLAGGRSDDTPTGLGVLAHELVHIARRRAPRFIPAILHNAPTNQLLNDEEAIAGEVERRVIEAAQQSVAEPMYRPTETEPPKTAILPDRTPWGNLPAPWEPWPIAPNVAPTPRPQSVASAPRVQPQTRPPTIPAVLPATTNIPAALPKAAPAVKNTPAASISSMPPTRALPPSASNTPDVPVVQRAELGRVTPAPSASGSAAQPAQPVSSRASDMDIEALARQVYSVLKRRLAAEMRRSDNT